jgi:glycosyltransferase involved in cell wall biosynthesis
MAMAMKVLISTNSAWNLLNFRMGLLQALAADGYSLVLAAPTDENVHELQSIGARFIDLPIQPHGTNPLKDLILLFRFVQLLRNERPDVLLLYTAKPNVFGSFASHWLGIPYINNISGLGSAFIRGGWLARLMLNLYGLALRRSRRVFFQNPDDLQLFLSLRLVTQSQAALLPGSGVDLMHFCQVSLPTLQSNKTNVSAVRQSFVFLLVARMLKDKGVEEFVHAAQIIKANYPHAEFAMLGSLDEGNSNAISAKQLDAWTNEGSVFHWGKSNDVRIQIAMADCVVLPSYREGTPRSLLEAAAMGRPLIATDVPGCREVVSDGVNGLLCKPQNAKDLAQKMAYMLSIPCDALQNMGNQSRKLVEKRFDEKLVINKYRNVLNEMV